MLRFWVRLSVALALMAPGTALAALTDPVRTESGLVMGVPGNDPSITVFKGLPYAAPPVGDLRWRPPRPPMPWPGVRPATNFGPVCPQQSIDADMSEDCLRLNIWTGASSKADKLPVLVWIYGGGFIQGSGSNPLFDGEALALKNLVVVTFNYRLGALGFLATPELSKESGHNASGNYGLLDDIALLKWVKENIAAFGGDPAKVTIAGQSAGAGSVGFLANSPLAKGLFIRAIAESHVRDPRDPDLRYLSVSWRALKTAEAQGVQYQAAHHADNLAALRALPWDAVIDGSNVPDMGVDTKGPAKPPLFRPVVDGWVVPASYNDIFARGRQNDVAFLAGNNKDETGAVPATAFDRLRASKAPPRAGAPQPHVRLADYVAAAKVKFGAMSDAFLKLYPATNDLQAALASNDAARDQSRISTFLWATAWRKGAAKPVYTYFWTHAPPGPNHDITGAYHGSEIAYVLGNVAANDGTWTDNDARIARIVSTYWANFAATGDPNSAGVPDWPAFKPDVPMTMELGDHFAPMPVASNDKIEFWKRWFAAQEPW
jgi:para-nitrobenzyl esterase